MGGCGRGVRGGKEIEEERKRRGGEEIEEERKRSYNESWY